MIFKQSIGIEDKGNNDNADGRYIRALPIFTVKRSKYKNVYVHHLYAFVIKGISPVMTYHPEDAEKRSYQLMKDIPTRRPDFDRDEIPYKTTLQHMLFPSKVSVAYLPWKENQDHGTDYGRFLQNNNIKPGDSFLVVPEDDKKEEPELEPVPSPTFVPYVRRQLNLFYRKVEVLNFNSPLIFLPSVQSLEWELPRRTGENDIEN